MSRGTLLLHACCGPCSLYPVQWLKEAGWRVTLVYANPNIHPLSEYLRRREALVECAARLEVPVLWRDDLWDVQGWLRHAVAAGVDTKPARCLWCYASRLRCVADMAQGYDAFSSTLLYSRYQRHEDIARLGAVEGQRVGVPFFYHDFREGWQQGIDMAKEYAIYRQPWCGCVYSEAERYEKKLKKLGEKT